MTMPSTEIEAPQALLVSSNPCGTRDIAGLGRRARLDRGSLGVAGVTVANARQAAGMLRGRHATGQSVPAPKPPKDWARLRYLAGILKTAPATPDDGDGRHTGAARPELGDTAPRSPH